MPLTASRLVLYSAADVRGREGDGVAGTRGGRADRDAPWRQSAAAFSGRVRLRHPAAAQTTLHRALPRQSQRYVTNCANFHCVTQPILPSDQILAGDTNVPGTGKYTHIGNSVLAVWPKAERPVCESPCCSCVVVVTSLTNPSPPLTQA